MHPPQPYLSSLSRGSFWKPHVPLKLQRTLIFLVICLSLSTAATQPHSHGFKLQAPPYKSKCPSKPFNGFLVHLYLISNHSSILLRLQSLQWFAAGNFTHLNTLLSCVCFLRSHALLSAVVLHCGERVKNIHGNISSVHLVHSLSLSLSLSLHTTLPLSKGRTNRRVQIYVCLAYTCSKLTNRMIH